MYLMAALIGFGIIVAGLIVFGLIAYRWGYDSRDTWNSPEWERRQRWFGGHTSLREP